MTVQFETSPLQGTPKGLGDSFFSCQPGVIHTKYGEWRSWMRSNTSVTRVITLKHSGRCACCEVAIGAGREAVWSKCKDGSSIVVHASSADCVAARDAINPTRKQVVTELRPVVTRTTRLQIKDNKLQYGLMVVPQPPTCRGNHKVCQTPEVICL